MRGAGFTLVELLITIAVISIVTGTLVPALGVARESSQSVVAMTNIRQLSMGQQAYAASNDDWLAGVNTSGAQGLIDGGDSFLWSTGSTVPTTTHDWVSPTLGVELGLPPNRAERTWAIFERLACPRARMRATTLWGLSKDLDDFGSLNAARPARQVSNLSPAAFHYSPGVDHWTPRKLRRARVWPKVGHARPYRVPGTWRPRLSSVSRPSGKVVVADGTRYLTVLRGPGGDRLALDFDVTPEPILYSSFTSSGPTFSASRAYGRSYLPRDVPDYNVDLSMRYSDREMHVGYFDGHGGRMAGLEAWSDPRPWYPRGSVFSGGDATPEVLEAVEAADPKFLTIE